MVVQAPERSEALITAECARERQPDLSMYESGLSDGVGAGTRRFAGSEASIIGRARDLIWQRRREFREAHGQGELPGDSTDEAPARKSKEGTEGAGTTKAGKTYWRT
jgi:predicted Rossmann fold nucleotide-binding protein DprA/Smf involved in DNA uptake